MGKRILFVLIAMLTLSQLAYGWEFSMTGEYEWRYRYFGRIGGSRDLFGDMNIQNTNATGTTIGFAGPNYYRGFTGVGTNQITTASNGASLRIVRGGFSNSESDAFVNDQRFTLYPKVIINKALDFHAMIDFAGIRQKYDHLDPKTNGPFERWYEDRVSRNAYDTALLPSVNQLRLTAHLPWGVLSVGGTKDYPFGTGALLARNTRASALVLVLPYGPFRIAPAIWLARSFEQDGFRPYAAANTLPGYTTNPDGATKNQLYIGPFLTYTDGPIDFGWTIIYRLHHANAAQFSTAADSTSWIAARDVSDLINVFYLKYTDGRLFANLEYGFQQADTHTTPRTFTGSARPLHVERSYAFAEAGALAGPSKLSLLFAWSGGDALNDNNPTKTTSGFAINYQAMLPYQYLMFYTYAGGNDAPWNAGAGFTVDENGQMADAFALGARLDYAVAANLNVWGSYLWAHRVEQNGFYAGWKSYAGTDAYPTVDANGNLTGYATHAQKVAAAQAWKAANGFGANANPYVDDGHIGWEINFGIDWKLLEGLTFRSRYAYWQPGKWFDQAYQAVTINGVQAGNTPTGTTGGYAPGKSAINAFEGSVEVNF